MSGKLVGFVLAHGPRDRDQAFVLVVLADAVSSPDDGWAFLGLPKLIERARYSRGVVLDALKKLEEDGWFAAVKRAAPGRSSSYRLSMEHLEHRVRLSDPIGSDPDCNGSDNQRQQVRSSPSAPPIGTDLNARNVRRSEHTEDSKARLAAMRRGNRP